MNHANRRSEIRQYLVNNSQVASNISTSLPRVQQTKLQTETDSTIMNSSSILSNVEKMNSYKNINLPNFSSPLNSNKKSTISLERNSNPRSEIIELEQKESSFLTKRGVSLSPLKSEILTASKKEEGKSIIFGTSPKLLVQKQYSSPSNSSSIINQQSLANIQEKKDSNTKSMASETEQEIQSQKKFLLPQISPSTKVSNFKVNINSSQKGALLMPLQEIPTLEAKNQSVRPKEEDALKDWLIGKGTKNYEPVIIINQNNISEPQIHCKSKNSESATKFLIPLKLQSSKVERGRSSLSKSFSKEIDNLPQNSCADSSIVKIQQANEQSDQKIPLSKERSFITSKITALQSILNPSLISSSSTDLLILENNKSLQKDNKKKKLQLWKSEINNQQQFFNSQSNPAISLSNQSSSSLYDIPQIQNTLSSENISEGQETDSKSSEVIQSQSKKEEEKGTLAEKRTKVITFKQSKGYLTDKIDSNSQTMPSSPQVDNSSNSEIPKKRQASLSRNISTINLTNSQTSKSLDISPLVVQDEKQIEIKNRNRQSVTQISANISETFQSCENSHINVNQKVESTNIQKELVPSLPEQPLKIAERRRSRGNQTSIKKCQVQGINPQITYVECFIGSNQTNSQEQVQQQNVPDNSPSKRNKYVKSNMIQIFNKEENQNDKNITLSSIKKSENNNNTIASVLALSISPRPFQAQFVNNQANPKPSVLKNKNFDISKSYLHVKESMSGAETSDDSSYRYSSSTLKAQEQSTSQKSGLDGKSENSININQSSFSYNQTKSPSKTRKKVSFQERVQIVNLITQASTFSKLITKDKNQNKQ